MRQDYQVRAHRGPLTYNILKTLYGYLSTAFGAYRILKMIFAFKEQFFSLGGNVRFCPEIVSPKSSIDDMVSKLQSSVNNVESELVG